MSVVTGLVKTTTPTSAPVLAASPSTVSTVAKNIAQTVTKKLTEAVQRTTEAFANADKVADSIPKEPKKPVIDESQFSQRVEGQILKLDSSQPLYEDDSHVFVYFMLAMLICAAGYILFHNKRKILALIIEGRQSHHSDVRRSGGVNYKRLNTEPPGVSVA